MQIVGEPRNPSQIGRARTTVFVTCGASHSEATDRCRCPLAQINYMELVRVRVSTRSADNVLIQDCIVIVAWPRTDCPVFFPLSDRNC